MSRLFQTLFSARWLLAAVLCPAPAYSLDPNRRLTQYDHRMWQTAQGLPEVKIDSIGQTADGYLWLGTYTGLIRFDGVKFTKIEGANHILANLWIRNLAVDSRQRLWIATNGEGIVQFQNGVMTQYAKGSGLPSGTAYCVVPTREGDMWACTPFGFARLKDGHFQVYKTGQGLATDSVYAACEAKDGTVWVGSESPQVSAWDGSRFKTRALHLISPDAVVRAMLCSEDGGLWVGTNRGLVQIKDGKERIFNVKTGLAGDRILSLRESRDGTLWIGTRDGFSRLRNGEAESFRQEDGLSQKMVYATFEDREGSLWIGTMHGLDQFLDGRGILYTAKEGLPSDAAGPVLEDGGGNTWLGTAGGGLARFDGRRFYALGPKQGISSQIYALANEGHGGLWAGTDAGLSFLRNGRVDRTYTIRDGLPSNIVRSLFIDRSGVLWAGTAAGPAKLEHGRFIQPAVMRQALKTTILAMGEDGAGRLYFARAPSGVSYYEDGAVRELLPEGPLSHADAFYTDQDHLLWIGTIGSGLKLAANGKVTNFVTRDGLFDNEIYGILADTQDRLWLASSKGVFSVSRSDLVRYAAGSIRILVSTPVDLLHPIECKPGSQPAAWRAHDGRLWFSTTRGAIVLDPNRLAQRVPPPSVVVEKLMANGESKQPEEIERLAPGRKNLEFEYTGLGLLEPDRTTFRYMLDGFDKEWRDAGTRREAFYTNLPPGKFRFQVTACNADGACNPTGSSVAFALAPYYYQRHWFPPLCAALLALAGWATHRIHTRRLREQLGLILAERNRIARELHDTLIQGFSGLTMQLQALSARVQGPRERSTLDDIIHDAETYLRETRQSVAGLRSAEEPNLRLTSAIADSARHLTAGKNVRLKLKLQESSHCLPTHVQYNLLRITQEAISNSVKHSGARNIEIALDTLADRLRLSIRDDGSGFIPEENGSRLGHYGLIGMKERAAQIGADLTITSAPGQGTTIGVLVDADISGSGSSVGERAADTA